MLSELEAGLIKDRSVLNGKRRVDLPAVRALQTVRHRQLPPFLRQ